MVVMPRQNGYFELGEERGRDRQWAARGSRRVLSGPAGRL